MYEANTSIIFACNLSSKFFRKRDVMCVSNTICVSCVAKLKCQVVNLKGAKIRLKCASVLWVLFLSFCLNRIRCHLYLPCNYFVFVEIEKTNQGRPYTDIEEDPHEENIS
jgi:hypothetical protein